MTRTVQQLVSGPEISVVPETEVPSKPPGLNWDTRNRTQYSYMVNLKNIGELSTEGEGVTTLLLCRPHINTRQFRRVATVGQEILTM